MQSKIYGRLSEYDWPEGNGELNLATHDLLGGGKRVTWRQKMPDGLKTQWLPGWIVNIAIFGFMAAFWFEYLTWSVAFLFGLVFLGAGLLYRFSLRMSSNYGVMKGATTKSIKSEALAFNKDGEWFFAFGFDPPIEKPLRGIGFVPLESFSAFEVGHYREWFAGKARIDKYYEDCHVIVILTAEKGVMPVAAHIGSKADLSPLMTELNRQFVEGRRALIATGPQRAAEKSPRFDKEVPDSL